VSILAIGQKAMFLQQRQQCAFLLQYTWLEFVLVKFVWVQQKNDNV